MASDEKLIDTLISYLSSENASCTNNTLFSSDIGQRSSYDQHLTAEQIRYMVDNYKHRIHELETSCAKIMADLIQERTYNAWIQFDVTERDKQIAEQQNTIIELRSKLAEHQVSQDVRYHRPESHRRTGSRWRPRILMRPSSLNPNAMPFRINEKNDS